MKIEGSHTLQSARDSVFAALTDPNVLQKCIPGCEELEKTGDNQYKARLSAGVGTIKAVFTATVFMEEVRPPSHYKLVVEGKAQPGFVKGTGSLDLEEQDGGTLIKYTGEVNVGGMLASVGQRMLQATASMLAGRFFSALAAETKAKAIG
ncbi:MAG TPA: carbon monoxide dehydrogenase subunit G [Verrucomicrobiae bacterium]|jgi:carbon monoxide dehydrogenase subunit G|nr:carbon monoxide dehydrogenase subunit G [Verrucomicrobiae bacterium]